MTQATKFRIRVSMVMVAVSFTASAVFAVWYVGDQNSKWCSVLVALKSPVAPLEINPNGTAPSPNVVAAYERSVRIQTELSKVKGSFC